MRKIIQACIAFLFLSSCTEKEFIPKDYPYVKTLSAVYQNENLVFEGKIAHLGTSGIQDHGFVWGENAELLRIGLQNTRSKGPKESLGVFSETILAGVEASKNYYMRAYSVNQSKVVYGEIIGFVALRSSPSPTIIDFVPKNGTWNDTITLTVENANFDNIQSNIVSFGSKKSFYVQNAGPSKLKVVVPPNVDSVSTKISLRVGARTTVTSENFELNPPLINSIIPGLGQAGTEVAISGANFGESFLPIVLLGSNECTIKAWTSKSITFEVPSISSGLFDVLVSILGQESTKVEAFEYLHPVVGSFAPASGNPGTIVEIGGGNFVPSIADNEVLFGTYPATIMSVTSTLIKVKVPVILPNDYQITVTSGANTIIYSEKFTVLAPPISEGLVGYFPFDGSAMDLSGTGNNGTISGAILAEDRYNNPESAYYFDGINDYIEIPDNPTLHFENQFSFSVWINLQVAKQWGCRIIDKAVGSEPEGFILDTYDPGSTGRKLRFQGINHWTYLSPTLLQLNTWYHIVFTFKDGMGKFYINGQLDFSAAGSNTTLENTSTPLRIGFDTGIRTGTDLDDGFKGLIDDVRIYNRELSASDVLYLFSN